jgi:RimJ/RimL family protein N-acetyltransferase
LEEIIDLDIECDGEGVEGGEHAASLVDVAIATPTSAPSTTTPSQIGPNSPIAASMCPESIELRPLTLDDSSFYERIYTDPRMWAELGGVVEQDMTAKLERDVASVETDRHWVLVIVIGDGVAAGTVSLWDHEWQGETIDEIGWMVLPEHQGRGLASAGVAEALRRADEAARWQLLHAFPATTNAPSNALCRKHGFALRGPLEYTYRARSLRVNHWVRDGLSR